MIIKKIKKNLILFSLAGGVFAGGLSFSPMTAAGGYDVTTPDQLLRGMGINADIPDPSQDSQGIDEKAAAQQELINSVEVDSKNSAAQENKVKSGKKSKDTAESKTEIGSVKTKPDGEAVLKKADNKKKVTLNTVTVDDMLYKITTLGAGALKDASDVEVLVLGESIEQIEDRAFSGADNLKKIKVDGSKAFRISKGAFGKLDTSKIKVVVSAKMSDQEYKKLQVRMRNAGFEGSFSKENAVSQTEIGSVKTKSDGRAVLEKAENQKKVALNSVKVGDMLYNIVVIGSGALDDASDVETLVLGESIEQIKESAFSGANSLKKIKVNGSKAFRISKGAFGKLDTSKIEIVVSGKMSEKEYKKLEGRMRNAGFKGKISKDE